MSHRVFAARHASAFAILAAAFLAPGCGGGNDTEFPGGVGGDGGSAGTGGEDAGQDADAADPVCGDGVVSGFEECDDQNQVVGDGCEDDCSFSCVAGSASRDRCDDGNACNGTETCSAAHTCALGTPLDDGAVCDDGKVCVSGNCVLASCGDGQVQDPEECDDGNVTPGDGCENDCMFSCVSTDPARDCSTTDACAGTSTCDDAQHACSEATPLADGTACDSGYCEAGACKSPTCGNQVAEPGEQCDDGNTDDADGCKQDCTYTCSAAQDCDDGDVCTADDCDGTQHTCSNTPDLTQDGQACTTSGSDGTCSQGQCVPAGCGNAVVDATEDCDLGADNGPGSGCTKACEFECQGANDCDDANACTGLETCEVVAGGRTCQAGTPLTTGSVCQANPRMLCDSSSACVLSVCGDLYIDTGAGEECDDGNTTETDGCKNDCKFTCTANGACADANPCTQDLCNTTSHTCSNPVDTSANGQTCNVGGVTGTCQAGVCTPANCGNSVVESGEQCDKGAANGPGSGCTTGCQFECNASTDCADANACNGTEVCATVTGGKTCQPGTALVTGAVCLASPRRICDAGGACVLSTCGDSFVDTGAGEQCDKGTNGPGTGCTTACQFECNTNTDCSDANSCNGTEVCATVTGGKTCQPGTPMSIGAVCQATPRKICDASLACVASICGDAYVDTGAGEECDNGTSGNGAGTGCTTSCKYECHVDGDCGDANACNGTETCATVSGGKTCAAGTPLSQGAVCLATPRRICNTTGSCVLSTCGDGYLDSGAGEQCEPPGTVTCDAACHTIAAVTCGDGVIGGTEQCDDHNTTNADGCDSACTYELFMRANPVTMLRGTAPSFCNVTTNRFGGAFSQLAIDNLNGTLTDSVTTGSLNLMFQAMSLEDLTGTADTSFQFGVVSADPDPAKGAWPAAEPTDWWFLLDPSALDANRKPTSRITPMTLAAHVFDGGPSDIVLPIKIGTTSAGLEMLKARAHGRFDSATNVPSPPPPALAAGLSVVQTLTANGTGEGLCGNITVESLSKIPVPESLTTGTNACRAPSGLCSTTRAYTYCGADQPVGPSCNSLLDVLVGGCKATFLCVNVVTPSQPDVSNGGTSPLTLSTNNKVPAAQTTANKNAYSSWFQFRARRQHATGVLP